MSVTVDIMDDRIHEDNETFIGILKISDFALDVISVGEPSTSVGIIIDDDVLGKYSHTHARKHAHTHTAIYVKN